MALKGIRVIEFAGLAPAPFCGMILADFGADVVRIDKIAGHSIDRLGRGKRSISVNLKSPEGIAVIRKLCEKADVLIEGFRPGVMEKLGLGPQDVSAINPGLIYARLTGFGQNGMYNKMAGHDINYLAVSGTLSMLGRKGEPPYAPGNLLGDFAGGGMLCALGICMGLLERTKSGKGQVIDAAMVDGAAYLSAFVYKNRETIWNAERGANALDGGAPFYETYECADGKHVTVGAIEPQFYHQLLVGLGLQDADLPGQMDTDEWPKLKQVFTEKFKSKTRDEWWKVFNGTDACVAPVLDMDEAHRDPHMHHRGSFLVPQEGGPEPAPAPKLSRTPGVVKTTEQPYVGEHTHAVLSDYGFAKSEIEKLCQSGVVLARAKASL
eukprot:Colp12_sorted_trinity150504_noHs@7812